MLSVSVGGAGQLDALARRLREAERKDLARELKKAVKKAPDHIAKAVREDSPLYMPKGYEQVFYAALEFTTTVRSSNGYGVTVKAKAKGAQGHDRQVTLLEKGTLRHPVFPRGRRSTWVWRAQRIRPRFFTEPALRTRHLVRQDIETAMHNVAQKIKKG